MLSLTVRSAGSFLLIGLLLSGCASRQPPPLSPTWEKDIRAFEAADRQTPPPRDAVLFVGSSSIRLWRTLPTDFPDYAVIQRGFGGCQMNDVLAVVDRIVVPSAPRAIFVYAGDNDLANGRKPADIEADFRDFARRVHRQLPRSHVAFIAIKPSPQREALLGLAAEANQRIARYCRRQTWLGYVDVFTPMLDAGGRPRGDLFVEDALHLNAAGYALWTGIVRRHLEGTLSARRR